MQHIILTGIGLIALGAIALFVGAIDFGPRDMLVWIDAGELVIENPPSLALAPAAFALIGTGSLFMLAALRRRA